MSDISQDIVNELKAHLKICHDSEDERLERMLKSSLQKLNDSCGEFDFDNEVGKELVFERCRYIYNDSLEFFSDNFLSEMVNLAISLSGDDE